MALFLVQDAKKALDPLHIEGVKPHSSAKLLNMSDPTSYREAYATLSRIAAELENGEADLDKVLPLLEEAQAAYGVCKKRIEAVKQVLEKDWEEDQPEKEN